MQNQLQIKQAAELADIMKLNYNNQKYEKIYNLWSFAFFWDGEKINDYSVTNPYKEFIPNIFDSYKGDINKTQLLIPRATSIPGHFSMLSLANRSILEILYLQKLEEAKYNNIKEVMSLVSDKKLIEELLVNFINAKEQNKIDTKKDLFDFILRYDLEKEKIIDSQKPQGSYINLATRLIYRYEEEKIEEELFSTVDKELSEKASKLHYESNNIKSQLVGKETLELNLKYLEAKEQIIKKPDRTNKVIIPGTRRVKSTTSGLVINWGAIELDRRSKRLSYQAFNPEEVMLSRIEKILTERFLNLYSQPELGYKLTIDTINEEISKSRLEKEKEVLNKIKKKFEIMNRFKDFDINHKMPVRIRVGGK